MADLYQTLVEERDTAPTSTRWVSYQAVGGLVGVIDFLLIVAAYVSAAIAYRYFFLSQTISVELYVGAGTIFGTIFVLLSRPLYRTNVLTSFLGQLRGVLFNWTLVLLITCLIFFLLKVGANYSRGTLLLFSFLSLGALVGSRFVISSRLSKALEDGTLDGSSAIIIGDRRSLAGLSRVQILRNFGASEIRRFELPSPTGNQCDFFAVVDSAIVAARANRAERVLLALRWDDKRQRELVCERLQILPVPVLLLPDQRISSLVSPSTGSVNWNLTIELQRPPLSSTELAVKRAADLFLAVALSVLLSPLIVLIVLLIKIESRGPVIFRQRRKGFNGYEFSIYKFRTMNVLEDGSVIRQARRNDPRVTRVGRLLRVTSLDELPQLINVIRGQMSLVGPRPHARAHDNEYAKLIANYAFRQHVRPGLTGWAQIHGLRGETARLELMEQRVAFDLWYIKNWSFWLDLHIIVRTFFELVRRRHAY
jgi:undecaprenyl-phosphate galactose phosphotransferase/putative colanic acid biosynthesis UDP-glucose lipid carrier transferase